MDSQTNHTVVIVTDNDGLQRFAVADDLKHILAKCVMESFVPMINDKRTMIVGAYVINHAGYITRHVGVIGKFSKYGF